MIAWLKSLLAANAKPPQRRSPRWPALRRAHLRKEPRYQACGGTEALEVHHVVPVHADPGLECDAANLVTLCELPGRNCHLTWGHAYSWRRWLPEVRANLADWRARLAGARQ